AAHALETTVELREPLSLLRAFLGGRTQARPQRERLFTAREAGRGAVTCRTRQRDAQRETPLVRDRDRVPTGWLADDAPVRRSEPLDRFALATAGARDRDEPADQLDVGLYASTLAVATSTRSICEALMTSGGR